MKKIIVWILALAMLPALAACGRTAAPAQTAAPAVEESAPAPAEAAPTGKVYWLSMRSEADEALQQLAAAYTAQTGVEVKVAVAAPEEYEAVLRGQMAGDEAPTLF
ncbi:MAG: carbohydrate ABC transporter substrate-binding protein, partial [Oscillospiraceae bacterium]|nr:carbohydrate ABC transporter substrate-binding protein [Oscillospiraceae bacterium]